MKFSDTKALSEYRLEQNMHQDVSVNDCTKVRLFAVCNDLRKPVITIIKISKKFMYDDDNNKYSYHDSFSLANKIPNLVVFTSASEAWGHFRRLLEQKENDLMLHVETETKKIENAKQFILEYVKKTPEYFI